MFRKITFTSQKIMIEATKAFANDTAKRHCQSTTSEAFESSFLEILAKIRDNENFFSTILSPDTSSPEEKQENIMRMNSHHI